MLVSRTPERAYTVPRSVACQRPSSPQTASKSLLNVLSCGRDMHAVISFSSSFAPSWKGHRSVSSKRVPVCVLETPGRKTSSHSTPAKTISPKQDKASSSPYYRVLPEDLSEDDAPPPPPVHRSVPFIGYLLESKFGLSTPTSRAKRYGGVYTSNFLVRPLHFVTHPGAMLDMIRNVEVFKNAGASEVIAAVFGTNSMILLDGADHSVARGALRPAFSPSVFPFYLDIILEQVHKTWAHVEKSVATNGKVLLDPTFRELYLSIIVKLTTGISMETEYASVIRKKFLRIQKAFFSPTFGPIFDDAMTAKQEVLDILYNVVEECLVKKADIIERLREYGDKLSHRGSKDIMKGDVNVLMMVIAFSNLKTGKGQSNHPEALSRLASLILGLWFAGYATTAATSSCAAFELGLDKSIWDQLTAEQDDITSRVGSKEVKYEQIMSEMPLLDSFTTEILRMYPSAVGVNRKVSRDIEVCGRRITAGSVLFFDFASAMRDDQMYEDPETLRIDRFVREAGTTPVPKVLTYGASGSPHYCLGAALAGVLMKSSLSVLLREYTMELDPKQSKKYNVVPEIVPQSKIVVQSFKKRNNI